MPRAELPRSLKQNLRHYVFLVPDPNAIRLVDNRFFRREFCFFLTTGSVQ